MFCRNGNLARNRSSRAVVAPIAIVTNVKRGAGGGVGSMRKLASGRLRDSPHPAGRGDTLDIPAIEQAYRRYARFYDVCFGAVFQPGRRAIVDRMGVRRGSGFWKWAWVPGFRCRCIRTTWTSSASIFPAICSIRPASVWREAGSKRGCADGHGRGEHGVRGQQLRQGGRDVCRFRGSVSAAPGRRDAQGVQARAAIFDGNHFSQPQSHSQERRTPACATVEATRILAGFFARPVSRSNWPGRHEHMSGESF